VSFTEENGLWRFDWREMIRRIAREQQSGADRGEIAARFMNTLVEMAVKECLLAREESGLGRVVLSGGSFQNMYIMRRLPAALEKEGFTVCRHRRVSPNDEGLSLGQLMIARAQTE
jgi:hydrogenase maturation protein HypF